MSLSRHAYRHAIQPASSLSSPLIDHVWISDDFLASTFRRFVNGGQQQRRYESRVPGPMEARRRLAKRRNTALASMAGAGPMDDIACLFGRNGREHMKWTDGQVRRAQPEAQAQGSPLHPLNRPEVPLPFYDQSTNRSELEMPTGWSGDLSKAGSDGRDKLLEEYLEKHWKVSAIRDFIRMLNIDLRQEPAYSRLVRDHLLMHSIRKKTALDEFALFLDDPFLNTPGAGNYPAAVEYLTVHEVSPARRRAIITAVTRALELGLIPPNELGAIVKKIPEIRVGDGVVSSRDPMFLTRCYRDLWKAIGRCDVLCHKDLNKETVDAWLGVLKDVNSHEALVLAKNIILGTQSSDSSLCSWVPLFIQRWLSFFTVIDPDSSAVYIPQLLDHFNPDVVSHYIIQVTESLALSTSRDHRNLLLEKWRQSLSELEDVSPLVLSDAWLDFKPLDAAEVTIFDSKKPKQSLKHHRIILRLWVLRTFSKSLDGAIWGPFLKATDLPAYKLFHLYEFTTPKCTGDFLPSLLNGINDLEIPFNGLLIMAITLRTLRGSTMNGRRTLEQLESSGLSVGDVFARLHGYNAMKTHLFPAFEKMVREVDVTDPSFVESSINLAKTGNSKSVWTLMRLLRSHTPLKIALSGAWQRIPDPSEMALVQYYPEPRTSDCPDPHLALEMIHLIAIAITASKRISPSRSFALIHWLYVFLMKHDAPVKPSLVRAMYEVGVVRRRRAGLRISPTQYNFIFGLVQEFETPEIAKTLMEPYHDAGWQNDHY